MMMTLTIDLVVFTSQVEYKMPFSGISFQIMRKYISSYPRVMRIDIEHLNWKIMCMYNTIPLDNSYQNNPPGQSVYQARTPTLVKHARENTGDEVSKADTEETEGGRGSVSEARAGRGWTMVWTAHSMKTRVSLHQSC